LGRTALIAVAAAGSLALGGCGGAAADDPANPPRLGQWTIARKAVNLRRNGSAVSADDHSRVYIGSGASPADDNSLCTEPKLADKEWLAGYIGSQLGRTCRITEASQSGASARGKGECGEGERGDSRPNETSFHYYADVGADSFSANVEVGIRTDLPTGAAELTAMTVKVEGTRTGECGS
jgi:hypothetical protein